MKSEHYEEKERIGHKWLKNVNLSKQTTQGSLIVFFSLQFPLYVLLNHLSCFTVHYRQKKPTAEKSTLHTGRFYTISPSCRYPFQRGWSRRHIQIAIKLRAPTVATPATSTTVARKKPTLTTAVQGVRHWQRRTFQSNAFLIGQLSNVDICHLLIFCSFIASKLAFTRGKRWQ